MWTRSFFGVQHAVASKNPQYRATVTEYSEGMAELQKWWPGCGFTPTTEPYSTADEARAAGEAWLAQH